MQNSLMAVGAYHIYRNEDDPAKQLHDFTNIAQLKADDLAPVINVTQLNKISNTDFIKD